MFVDRIKVFAQAGNGGRGSVSFRREKFVPKGGPDGGDGGRGGDVILRADRHVDNLSNLFYEPIIKAKNGGHGMGKKMAGRSASPKIVKVPLGTLVHRLASEKFEIQDYRRATIADIPGLIEGAHRGLGLGHEFLRHITRCRIFLFVVDVAGSEGRNPVEDVQQLRKELDLYDSRLSERPWFLIANKMDLPAAEENLKALRKKFPKIDIVPISAAKGDGIEELKKKLARWLEL